MRFFSRLLIVIGCLVSLAGVGYIGYLRYLITQESTSPSTSRVLVLKNGDRIPLVQPDQRNPVQNSGGQALVSATGTPVQNVQQSNQSSDSIAEVTTTTTIATTNSGSDLTPTSEVQVLPPVRIVIPGTKTDWPVVLSNGVQLPRFKALGWLVGSTYPGAPGNMVLFGHLDGQYSTLPRLNELEPGATFSVYTDDAEYSYRVRAKFETTPDDVAVMAPTNTATATIITCSGHWDKAAGMYDHRLIIVADYVEAIRLTN